MGLMRHDEIGRCDFIDVLEEAVLTRQPVVVKLRDGQTFTDTVKDLVTEDGEDHVVFGEHPRAPLSAIHGCSRSEPVRH
jgi:transcriptional antiterminator Rof (Rho-off)